MVEKGIARPTDIKAEYQTQYPNQKPRSLDAYVKALKRQGFTKDVRDLKAVEFVRKAEGRHILEYKEIESYLMQAKRVLKVTFLKGFSSSE
jgi:hypothetical protein